MKHFDKRFSLVDSEHADECIKTKYRGIDPFVKTENGTLERLTLVDEQYAREAGDVRLKTIQGWHVAWADRSSMSCNVAPIMS